VHHLLRDIAGSDHRGIRTAVLQDVPTPLSLAPLALALTGETWSQAAYVFGISSLPGGLVTGFAAAMLIVVTAAQLLRVSHPRARRQLRADLAEPNHTMPLAALPTTAAVLAAAALPRAPTLSLVLWIAAAVGLCLCLAWALLRTLHLRQPVRHVGPPWMTVSIGLMLLPVAGLTHGLIILSTVAFTAGLGLGLGVLCVMSARGMAAHLHPPLTPAERVLLAAWPAIIVLGHQALNGGVLDADALVLLLVCIVGAIATAPATWRQARQLSSASWWSIPLIAAATTLVIMVTYDLVGGRILAWASIASLVGTSLLALYATFRTFRHYASRDIRAKLFIERPESHG